MFKHELVNALNQMNLWERVAAEQGFSVTQFKVMIESERFSFDQYLQIVRSLESPELLKWLWGQLKPEIQRRAVGKGSVHQSIRIH
jgi:hypothetical protein